MTTATTTRPRPAFAFIAEMKDGTARFLTRSRRATANRQLFTTSRQWARKHATYASADEEAGRLNGVAAAGHYWQEVAYFRVAPTTTRRKGDCHDRRQSH